MRQWRLSHGRNGYQVEVVDVPRVLVAAEWISERLMTFTGHIICCKIPEFAWKVPLSRKRDPDYPEIWERSLGSVMWQFSTYLLSASYRRNKSVTIIPITEENATCINPMYVQEMREIEID